MQRQEYPVRIVSTASIARNLVLALGVLAAAVFLISTKKSVAVGIGVVVGLIGAGHLVLLLQANKPEPPLVVGEDAVEFAGKKLYYKDIEDIQTGSLDVKMSYLPLTIKAGHGTHTLNVLRYQMASERVGPLVGEIHDRWNLARAVTKMQGAS